MDTDVTDHLLATTRAVRKRLDLDRPVEAEVIVADPPVEELTYWDRWGVRR